MPTEAEETAGQTFKRGMAWGAGFALISIPLAGLLKIVWHSITDDKPHTHSTEIDTSEED